MKKTNKVTIKITALPETSVPHKVLLQKMCNLRTAEKVGDEETINHTQLGNLKYQNVKFEIIG